MRTKTTLLTAALIAAGVASSMAQSQVYSLNIVGYITVTLTNGYNLLSAPLVSTSASINTVLGTNLAESNGSGGTQPLQTGFLEQYKNGGFITTYAGGDGNWYTDQTYTAVSTNTIAPGDGFYINNQDGVPVTLTITGSVLTGTNSYTVPAGYSFLGQFEPISGDITTNNFPVGSSDFLVTWNPATQLYNPGIYGVSASDNDTTYGQFYTDESYVTPVAFVPTLAQGWLYFNGETSATNWIQMLAP